MFLQDANDGFSYKYKGSRKECDGELCFRRHTFAFRSRNNQVYIVELDEFDEFNLCLIKFYLKSHRLSKDKFKLFAGLNEAPGVISTCLQIILDYFKKNPYHSFAFVGANSKDEAKNNTKRFKLYRQIMKQIFSSVEFNHLEKAANSVYLLLNRNYSGNNPTLLKDMEAFFNKHYLLL